MDDKQNPRTFRTIETISLTGAEPLRGRGTRVFKAVELGRDGYPRDSPHVVLKDIWIDSDRDREGTILTSLHEAANDNDKHLVEEHFLTAVCHGDVWISPTRADILDDTANALMRKLDIASDHGSKFRLQRVITIIPPTPTPSGSKSNPISESVCAQTFPPHKRYPPKTHYRIVFKEVAEPICQVKELGQVMKALSDTVVGAF